MVPNSGRYATLSSVPLLEAALREVFVLRGPGGECSSAGPRTWREGDRAPARTSRIDDLARVAPKRGYPRRHLHLPGDHGAVACGPSSSPSKALEAGHERETAAVCAGASGGHDRDSGRKAGRRADGRLEGASARSPEAPALGPGVEPGTDRPPSPP